MATLLLAAAGIAAALYAPGYLFFRALRFTRLHALIAAPLMSAACYGVFPVVYYEVGISCTILSTFGVALVIGVVAYAVAMLRAKRGCVSRSGSRKTFPESGRSSKRGGLKHVGSRSGSRTSRPTFGLPVPLGSWRRADSPRESACDWGLALLYLACGLAIGCIVFAGALPTADATYIRYDNQTHVNVSKAFLDSGMWSSLHPNRYLDLPVDSRPVISGGISFYPALLFALSALCALIANVSITAAFNATLFTLCFVVFPLGMFGIIRTAFPNNRLVIVMGAIAAISFTAFPWGVFVRGLFPNAAGICFMTPAIASTMILLEHPRLKAAIPRGIALWICALPALGLAQPNAVFGAFMFLVFYLTHNLGKRAQLHALEAPALEASALKTPAQEGSAPKDVSRESSNTKRLARACESSNVKRIAHARRLRMMVVAAILLVALVLWLVAMNLPALQSVTSYFANSIQSPTKVIRRTLTLRVDPFWGQWLLAVIVLIGVIALVRRRILWILIPAAWMCLAYILIRTANTPLAHFLAGFWYCDHVRIGACYTVFLTPIAACGLASIARTSWQLTGRIAKCTTPTTKAIAAAVVVVLCLVVVFFPNVTTPSGNVKKTGYGTVYTELSSMYRIKDNRVYGSDEQAFVDKAREITQDDLVLNYPADGSSFAYAVNDMHVYWRNFKTKNQTEAAKIIRTNLVNYATDESVQEAVKSTGAHWLLRLDQGVSYEDGKWFRQFRKPEKWEGIEAVDENTPGFTCVLAEGDMRLYRIDY